MDHIYFLTIDQLDWINKPTKDSLLNVRDVLCERLDMSTIKPWKVEAFEWKYSEKHGRKLHYHVLLKSKKYYIPYKDSHIKGYSIVLEKLKTHLDVARTAGYIMKSKIDKVDLDMQTRISPFKKDKKVNTKVIKANPIMMYFISSEDVNPS